MKTYNGKNVTKKHIEAVLRSMNQTSIYRLYHKIYGVKPTFSGVFDFIRQFAPTDKVRSEALSLTKSNSDKQALLYGRDWSKKTIAYHRSFPLSTAMSIFRHELSRGSDSYSKRPFYGRTHLYFCSPVFGHADYNKSRSVPIEGNERFCELLVRLADKHMPAAVSQTK